MLAGEKARDGSLSLGEMQQICKGNHDPLMEEFESWLSKDDYSNYRRFDFGQGDGMSFDELKMATLRWVEEQSEARFQQWVEHRRSKNRSVELVQVEHDGVKGRANNEDERRTAGLWEARMRRMWITGVW